MKNTTYIPHKIVSLDQLQRNIAAWRLTGKTIALTNGCFDLLHEGHVFSLMQAAAEADYLVVGLNADASVRRLKGPARPIRNQQSRAMLMASLQVVDAVVVFEEDTPVNLINAIRPDVYVKGGDYTLDQLAGAQEVMKHGGRVVINPLVPGISTTLLIEKMKYPG